MEEFTEEQLAAFLNRVPNKNMPIVDENEKIMQAEALIADGRFQELIDKQSKANVFSILGQSHTEHWHSAFYKWLLDPGSTVGLGAFPLKRFLMLYVSKKSSIRPIDVIDLDTKKEFTFENEKSFTLNEKYSGWKGGSIDIYGENSEYVIVIENKVSASEEVKSGIGQTDLYYHYFENESESRNKKKIYVFLTPDEDQLPKCDEFAQITYQEMYDNVLSKCLSHPALKAEPRYIIEQYVNNLGESYNNIEKKNNKKQDRESSVRCPMALTNKGLCERIYESHGEILDDIYNTVKKSNEFGALRRIYTKYKGVFDEIYMSLEKYDETPDGKKAANKKIKFTQLYKDKKVEGNEKLYMEYGGATYYAQLYIEDEKCYLRLLDENWNPIQNVDKTYTEKIEAVSAAANNVIKIVKNNFETKVSVNGKGYWKIEGTGESVVKWYEGY